MANKERFKIIPAVYLVLRRGDDILLLRRFQTGYEDGNYSMIAGHADEGESLRQAIAREAKEEAGIVVDIKNLQHLLTMHRLASDHERADFFFTADRWDGEIINVEPNKCDDLSWFPLSKMPENIIPYIRTAVDCYMKGEKYCEFGWEK